jgi:hypothetical protein
MQSSFPTVTVEREGTQEKLTLTKVETYQLTLHMFTQRDAHTQRRGR